jgi:hypothetical protein
MTDDDCPCANRGSSKLVHDLLPGDVATVVDTCQSSRPPDLDGCWLPTLRERLQAIDDGLGCARLREVAHGLAHR